MKGFLKVNSLFPSVNPSNIVKRDRITTTKMNSISMISPAEQKYLTKDGKKSLGERIYHPPM